MEKSKPDKFKRATAKGRQPLLGPPFQSASDPPPPGPWEMPGSPASVSDAPPGASTGSAMLPGILMVTVQSRLRRRGACALGWAPCYVPYLDCLL